MPGKKQPTALVKARGGFKNRPSRARNNEPEVRDPLGSPPEQFKPDEVEAWRGIVERAPLGVLTAADWHSTVIASKLFAEFMRDSEAMNAARISKLNSLLGSFGMTPSDRAGLSIPQAEEVNPFDEFDTAYR